MSKSEASIHRPSVDYRASTTPGSSAAAMTCFGVASVTLGNSEQAHIAVGLGKPLALLAYLSLSPNRSAPRERLADLLWSDQERAVARHSLRRALSYLRRRIGAWVVEADDHVCMASPALALDVHAFTACAQQGRFRDALEIYRGPFLADFSSPGCGEFESWAEVERAHYRSTAFRVAEAWSRSALDHAQFADARLAAGRMKEIDPLSQAAWRMSLEVLVACGDRIGAAAEAARFQAWLEAEEFEPEPASHASIRGVTTGKVTVSASRTHESSVIAELVGREKEFTAILDAWRKAQAGKVHRILVSGGPGLGKTRLLDSVADRIRSNRERVVTVRAFPGESAIAFSFAGAVAYEVAQLPGAAGVGAGVAAHLRSLDPRLEDRFPNASTSAGGLHATAARATAIRELLAAVSDEAPLALLLDDEHWCDEASRQVLAGAFSRASDGALLIVISSRRPESGAILDDRAQVIHLHALSERDVEALVASVAAWGLEEDLLRIFVSRLAAASRGIPLYLLAALEHLLRDGALTLRDGMWLSSDPLSLRARLDHIDALADRIRRLSEPSYHVLLACAAAGVPLPREIVQSIVAADRSSMSAVNDLEQLGFVRVNASGISITHDAIGETALIAASEDERRHAHRALGNALVARVEHWWIEHGLRHLSIAGEVKGISLLLAGAVRRHQMLSGQDAETVMATLLDRPRGDAVVHELVGQLPAAVRHPRLWLVARVAAAALLVVGVSGALFRLTSAGRGLPAIEILQSAANGATSRAEVALSDASWDVSSPLVASFEDRERDTIPRARLALHFAPDGGRWVLEAQSPDTGGIDVMLVDRKGMRRRLTSARADENPSSWSPDGKSLVISTSAFNPSRDKTLGILDLASGVVRPFGSNEYPVGLAAWSPDGTRIAYLTSYGDTLGSAICVRTVSGIHASCARSTDAQIRIAGWLDDSRLLLHNVLPSRAEEFDVLTSRIRPIGVDNIFAMDLSPDGQWVWYSRGSGSEREMFVARASEPRAARRIATSIRMHDGAQTAWAGHFAQRPYLDSVLIDAPSDSIPTGMPFQLAPRGRSNLGHDMRVHGVEWKSLTPGTASIDAAGLLTPLRVGVATIELSAGGWRSTRRSFVIHEPASTLLLDERWSPSFTRRWSLFGEPLPTIVTDSALGTALLNNGDGYFFSGVYLSRPLDGRGGITLETSVRVPSTRFREQYMNLGFLATHDLDRVHASWNHSTGYLPREFFSPGGCFFSYSAREGSGSARSVSPHGVIPPRATGQLEALRHGDPVRIRIQILPDRRCAVTVGDQPTQFRDEQLAQVDSLTVAIQGNSMGTRLLVGPVKIKTGTARR